MVEVVVGDDDYGEDFIVCGEFGVWVWVGLGVVVVILQCCLWCWWERLFGCRDGGQLGVEYCVFCFCFQFDLLFESLFEIRFLGFMFIY